MGNNVEEWLSTKKYDKTEKFLSIVYSNPTEQWEK